jgi:hypothetical protein
MYRHTSKRKLKAKSLFDQAFSFLLLVSGEKNEARPNDLAFFMVD